MALTTQALVLNMHKIVTRLNMFFFVICLFFQEQIYTYMILYTQCFSTQKLQCKKNQVDLHNILFYINF